MTTHIMCDLETIGKRPGCIVLAAAFVRFSDEAHCTLNLSIPDQQAFGLEQDPETAAWWQGQEAQHPGAWATATANPTPLATALPYFLDWVRWAAPDGDFLLWCHGATFDAPILGEVYRRAGVPCPWTEQFWRVQCTRTLYNLAGVNPKDYAVPPPHVALNDAIGQTRAANAALAILARAHNTGAAA
jgi:exodeoxyribonuclease VIII